MIIQVTKYDGIDHLELLSELTLIAESHGIEANLDTLTPDGRQQCTIHSPLARFIVVQKLQEIVDNSDIIDTINVTLEIQ